MVDDPQRVLVVPEAEAEARAQGAVERRLARVPEGRVTEVVAESDRLGQVLVQTQRARDRARDAGRLDRVRQPRAVVVALGRDEDLGLVLEPPERLAVHDAVAVALERRAQRALLRLGMQAPAARGGAHRERPEQDILGRGEAGEEAVGNRAVRVHRGHAIPRLRGGHTDARAVQEPLDERLPRGLDEVGARRRRSTTSRAPPRDSMMTRVTAPCPSRDRGCGRCSSTARRSRARGSDPRARFRRAWSSACTGPLPSPIVTTRSPRTRSLTTASVDGGPSALLLDDDPERLERQQGLDRARLGAQQQLERRVRRLERVAAMLEILEPRQRARDLVLAQLEPVLLGDLADRRATRQLGDEQRASGCRRASGRDARTTSDRARRPRRACRPCVRTRSARRTVRACRAAGSRSRPRRARAASAGAGRRRPRRRARA